MPLSGLLAETALGWKMIFYVTSAIMFLTSGLWYWFSASSPAEHSMMTEMEKTYIEMGLNTNTETRVRKCPNMFHNYLDINFTICANETGKCCIRNLIKQIL